MRDEFRAKVAGLGLMSATFACSVLKGKLAPGTRIVIGVPIFRTNEYGDEFRFVGRRQVNATINASKGSKFSCIVDPEHEEGMIDDSGELTNPGRIRFRKMQSHTRIVRWLDEPKRARCSVGSIKLLDGTCDVPKGEHCHCKQDQFREVA